jgi:hypothetical protein
MRTDMNGYEKAQALGLSGTTAENVAVLQTLAVDDITRLELGKWLRETKMLSSTGTEWYGTLEDAIKSGDIKGDTLTGINDLKSILAGIGGDGLATTHPYWAGVVWKLISTLAAGNPEIISSFYDRCGGRPYADMSEELYSSQKEAAEAAQAKAALVQYAETRKTEFDAAYNLTLRDINNGQITTEAGVNDSLGVVG